MFFSLLIFWSLFLKLKPKSIKTIIKMYFLEYQGLMLLLYLMHLHLDDLSNTVQSMFYR
ncbi:hypothetical protein DR79_1929 [Francisella tularensis]|nr:hypothetical protein DR79_1929 [Francisella tularensis]